MGNLMTRLVSITGLLLCLSFSASAAAPARRSSSLAASSADEGHVNVAALIGYGIGFSSAVDITGATGPKPYGFMFGARGGYLFPCHIYAGGTFLYDLGTSTDVTIGGRPGSLSAKMFTITAEGGYQFEWVDRFRLRPYLGLGIARASISASFSNGQEIPQLSDSAVYFAVQPGVVFEYSFFGAAPGPFVGIDEHFSFTTGSGTQGLVSMATGGWRF